ncbi:MAG TPA: tryptophan dimethylallyltransferase family protein, partial [Polyangiaceae bacterium]|nr:tryptophan dimethylallyltransferase family protein [Polyangiaceae bacterium]
GTLAHQLDSRLSRLLRALGQRAHLPNARRVSRLLASSWRGQLVDSGAKWSSDITDDHSPFEFSLALDGSAATLRILTEPQDVRQPSLARSWSLAGDIHEKLASRWGAGLGGYTKVADLFEPTAKSQGAFSVWHSAILSAAHPEFKVYLNPAIHGAGGAEQVVAAAFGRLGLGEAWRTLSEAVLRRSGLDQVIYFSVDLTDTSEARAKIYVAHREATAADLTRALEPCSGFDAASIERWSQHLMGGTGPFHERPPITCFALRRGSLELHTTTLHLPVRCYAIDDFEVARKVCTFLPFRQRVEYMRAVTELAERPLESGPGLQTYVSVRPSPGRESLTVYLAPQVYSTPRQRSVEAAGFGLFRRLDEPRAIHAGHQAR